MPKTLTRRQALVLPVGIALGSFASRYAMAADPVKVGLVAALSGQSAKSGEGITRGLTIAIDEINAGGGVLGGRMLELVRRDDESNPAKGQTAARELIDKEGVAILFGGIDSPVSQAIVPLVNAAHVPFMGVWAAATNITRNGANPNYVFRVSAVDVLVDRALIKHAMASFGAKTPGLMLVNNGWGESNLGGLTAAAEAAGIKLAGSEKFEDKDVDMTPQLQRLREAGADAVILVGNAAPGAQVVKSLQRSAWPVPVVSHWGISGGRFPELAPRPAIAFAIHYDDGPILSLPARLGLRELRRVERAVAPAAHDDHVLVLHAECHPRHLNFKVVRLRSPKMIARIRNLVMILGSCHPMSSK